MVETYDLGSAVQLQAEVIARDKAKGAYKEGNKIRDTIRLLKMKADGHSLKEITELIYINRMTIF